MATKKIQDDSEYSLELARMIYTKLLQSYNKKGNCAVFTRAHGRKFVIDLIKWCIDNNIQKTFDEEWDSDAIGKYSKGEFVKTLIKHHEGGNNAGASKLLADIRGFNSATDEYIVVPINYKDLPDTNSQKIAEDYDAKDLGEIDE